MEKFTEFRYKSCVYCIENTSTGNVYIGQSRQYPTRIYGHFQDLTKKKHCTPKFQAEFDEYGENSFTVCVLEECDSKLLGEREFYWMGVYKNRLLNTFMKNA